MPEVTVRRRVRRRPTPLSERFERWAYRYRPQIVVVCAFLGAVLLGAICLSLGTNALQARSGASEAAQAQ